MLNPLRSVLPLCSLVLLALAGVSCATSPDGGCDPAGDPQAFDLCVFEQVKALDTPDVAAAEALVVQINDPVVRSAAVQHWVRQHPTALAEPTRRLCALLPDLERGACDRRVNSPHLSR